jgi:hypothetical protein
VQEEVVMLLWMLASALADELPAGWKAQAPVAGDFAASFRYHSVSSCSQSWSIYDVDAAVTLTLAENGRALGCRERRSDDQTPDGQYIAAHLQSMTGRYTRDGDWITLVLRPGGDRCGTARSSAWAQQAWSLRCTQAKPPEDSPLSVGSPLLVCQFTEPVYTESLGMRLVRSSLPGDQWMVLGSGVGIDVVQDFGDEPFFFSAEPATPLVVTARTAAPEIGKRVAGLVFSKP